MTHRTFNHRLFVKSEGFRNQLGSEERANPNVLPVYGPHRGDDKIFFTMYRYVSFLICDLQYAPKLVDHIFRIGVEV